MPGMIRLCVVVNPPWTFIIVLGGDRTYELSEALISVMKCVFFAPLWLFARLSGPGNNGTVVGFYTRCYDMKMKWLMGVFALFSLICSAEGAFLRPTSATASSILGSSTTESRLIDEAGSTLDYLTLSAENSAATHPSSSGGLTFGQWLSANNDVSDGAWVALDLGAAYNLTHIYIWQGSQTGKFNKGVDAFSVDVSTNGAAWHQALASTNMPISTGGDIRASVFSLANASAVRYARINITSSHGNSQVGLSEVRFGGALAPESIAPTILTYSPVDDAREVVSYATLVATFDEIIVAGSGNITITNLTDGIATTLGVGDAQVMIDGATLTLNPSNDLLYAKRYAVLMDAGAVVDSSSNPFAGIADMNTWNFTTEAAPLPVIRPTGVTASSRNGATTHESHLIQLSGTPGDKTLSDETTNATHPQDDGGENFGQWLTAVNDLDDGAWVQFDLGELFALSHIYVWQGNETTLLGRGVKAFSVDVLIYGTVWQQAVAPTNLPISTGGDIRADVFALANAASVQYVRMNITSTHGGTPRAGLSEVRFVGGEPRGGFLLLIK
jgi:hypothetical protein